MTPRHAVALALVGWYLLVPPSRQTDIPLGRWKVVDSFESKSLCDLVKTDDLETWLLSTQGILTPTAVELNEWVKVSRCISADDPRLKAN